MNHYETMLESYKHLAENVEDLTDEQIDEVIKKESDLLKGLDVMIASKKFYADRKKLAEQNEKLTTRIMLRIMKALGIENFEGENGKAKMMFSYKFDSDLEKLPKEFLMINYKSIEGKLAKGESIVGVVQTDKLPYVRIR